MTTSTCQKRTFIPNPMMHAHRQAHRIGRLRMKRPPVQIRPTRQDANDVTTLRDVGEGQAKVSGTDPPGALLTRPDARASLPTVTGRTKGSWAPAPWQIPAVTRVVPANVAVLEFHSGLAVGLLAGIDLELAVLRGFGPQTC